MSEDIRVLITKEQCSKFFHYSQNHYISEYIHNSVKIELNITSELVTDIYIWETEDQKSANISMWYDDSYLTTSITRYDVEFQPFNMSSKYFEVIKDHDYVELIPLLPDDNSGCHIIDGMTREIYEATMKKISKDMEPLKYSHKLSRTLYALKVCLKQSLNYAYGRGKQGDVE